MSCVETLWECLQCDHALNHVCNQTNGWARHHGRGDVKTSKHKSTWGGTGLSFMSFSNRYSVCVCRSVLWVLFSVVCPYTITWNKLHNELSEQIALQAVHSSLLGHTVFMWPAWEQSMQSQFSRELTARFVSVCHYGCMLSEGSIWGGSFHQLSPRCRHCIRRGCTAAALVGIKVGSGGGNEDGRAPIFFLSHQIQRPLSGIGSPPRGFFPSWGAWRSACLPPRRWMWSWWACKIAKCLHKHCLHKYIMN